MVAQEVDLFTHLLTNFVRRLIEVELQDNGADILGRGRTDGINPADGAQLGFQLLGYLIFDFGGPRARIDGNDHNDGKFDIWKDINRHPKVGKDTHNDAGHQHHGHKDRLAN